MATRPVASTLVSGFFAALVALGVAAAYPALHGDPKAALDPSSSLLGPTSKAHEISAEDAQRARASAKDLSTAFRVAADQMLPSVVMIQTTPEVTPMAERRPGRPNVTPRENPFEGTPFEDFFRQFPGRGFGMEGLPGQPVPRTGMGSGVIIDASGIILTNNHVVSGGKVVVRLYDGREFTAASVATDPQTDIAIVKIEGVKDLVPAKLGDSDAVAVGDWVLALGQPFGLESTVTAGIISALQRGVGITARESFLQTDAAINPGNSGGPLVNLDGEVIGINTAISSRSGGNDGVGFAVPINLARWVADQLATEGKVLRAFLGVGIQPVTAELAEQFNVKPREGVVVTDVFPNTPAAKAGLKSGDVIVGFAGRKVTSPQELQLAVERAAIGKSEKLVVLRGGKQLELSFKAEQQPSEFGTAGRRADRSGETPDSQFSLFGMEVSELDAAVAEQLGIQDAQGVVITSVQPGSPAARAGLESGMVISQVNRKPVTSVDELRAAVKAAKEGDNLLLLVRTAVGSRFVVVKP